MPKFKTSASLQKYLQQQIVRAMTLTRDAIHEIAYDKVKEYYEEEVFQGGSSSEPAEYKRTGELMMGLSASHIITSNNSISFKVGWDDDYLTFMYDAGFGNYPFNQKVSGKQVLEFYNSGQHGNLVIGSHNFWDETIEEINSKYGGVTALFKKKLKECGISVV